MKRCSRCNRPIQKPTSARSEMCANCRRRFGQMHERNKSYGIPIAGFYTEVTDRLTWCGGRIWDGFEIRKLLQEDELRIGALIEYWTTSMRDGDGILYVVSADGLYQKDNSGNVV